MQSRGRKTERLNPTQVEFNRSLRSYSPMKSTKRPGLQQNHKRYLSVNKMMASLQNNVNTHQNFSQEPLVLFFRENCSNLHRMKDSMLNHIRDLFDGNNAALNQHISIELGRISSKTALGEYLLRDKHFWAIFHLYLQGLETSENGLIKLLMKTVNTLLQNTFKPKEILQIRDMVNAQIIKEEIQDQQFNSQPNEDNVDPNKLALKKWEIDTQEQLQNLQREIRKSKNKNDFVKVEEDSPRMIKRESYPQIQILVPPQEQFQEEPPATFEEIAPNLHKSSQIQEELPYHPGTQQNESPKFFEEAPPAQEEFEVPLQSCLIEEPPIQIVDNFSKNEIERSIIQEAGLEEEDSVKIEVSQNGSPIDFQKQPTGFKIEVKQNEQSYNSGDTSEQQMQQTSQPANTSLVKMEYSLKMENQQPSVTTQDLVQPTYQKFNQTLSQRIKREPLEMLHQEEQASSTFQEFLRKQPELESVGKVEVTSNRPYSQNSSKSSINQVPQADNQDFIKIENSGEEHQSLKKIQSPDFNKIQSPQQSQVSQMKQKQEFNESQSYEKEKEYTNDQIIEEGPQEVQIQQFQPSPKGDQKQMISIVNTPLKDNEHNYNEIEVGYDQNQMYQYIQKTSPKITNIKSEVSYQDEQIPLPDDHQSESQNEHKFSLITQSEQQVQEPIQNHVENEQSILSDSAEHGSVIDESSKSIIMEQPKPIESKVNKSILVKQEHTYMGVDYLNKVQQNSKSIVDYLKKSQSSQNSNLRKPNEYKKSAGVQTSTQRKNVRIQEPTPKDSSSQRKPNIEVNDNSQINLSSSVDVSEILEIDSHSIIQDEKDRGQRVLPQPKGSFRRSQQFGKTSLSNSRQSQITNSRQSQASVSRQSQNSVSRQSQASSSSLRQIKPNPRASQPLQDEKLGSGLGFQTTKPSQNLKNLYDPDAVVVPVRRSFRLSDRYVPKSQKKKSRMSDIPRFQKIIFAENDEVASDYEILEKDQPLKQQISDGEVFMSTVPFNVNKKLKKKTSNKYLYQVYVYDEDLSIDNKRVYHDVNLEIDRIIQDNSKYKGLYQIVEVSKETAKSIESTSRVFFIQTRPMGPNESQEIVQELWNNYIEYIKTIGQKYRIMVYFGTKL